MCFFFISLFYSWLLFLMLRLPMWYHAVLFIERFVVIICLSSKLNLSISWLIFRIVKIKLILKPNRLSIGIHLVNLNFSFFTFLVKQRNVEKTHRNQRPKKIMVHLIAKVSNRLFANYKNWIINSTIDQIESGLINVTDYAKIENLYFFVKYWEGGGKLI